MSPRPPAPRIPTDIRAKQALLDRRLLLEAQRKVYSDGLPHLYGFKWYRWAKAFYESRNKMNLLVAANQISKSTTQWRKVIRWATDRKLWPILWPRCTPRIFWYLYPSKDVATVEWEKKILPELMPRGEFKDHPDYGWEIEYDGKYVHAIHFKTGVTVYFRTYNQRDDVHQSATVAAIFCDEELPEELYPELSARLIATDGFFHMVFTATLNQSTWRRAMEGHGDQELFPEAFKLQVSMYDCQVYADGTPGAFSVERIHAIEKTCANKTEIDRRVHGRFVTEIGRKYGAFEPTVHFIKPVPIPGDWKIYPGVDCGAGGKKNHPGSILWLAVRPDCQLAYAFAGWRGDNQVTTAGDIFDKFREMKREIGRPTVLQGADPRAKDFHTIATRAGEPFQKSEASHDIGEALINTLFKNSMLFLFDIPELHKLGGELVSLLKSTPKEKAEDDFTDGLRYAAVLVPWDWSAIKGNPDSEGDDDGLAKGQETWTEEQEIARQIRARRGEAEDDVETPQDWREIESEIDEWNEAYGT